MKKKVVVALGVFVMMFIVAWWANEINEKRYYVDEADRQIQLYLFGEVDQAERFRPREYIKIQR